MATPISTIRRGYRVHTDKIRNNPHNPQHWLARAKFFLDKYPEPYNRWPLLAAGDAYKVYKYFCDRQFRKANHMDHIPTTERRDSRAQACNILVPALLALNCADSASIFVKEMTSLPTETKNEILNGPSGDRGSMKRQKYPWIPGSFMCRGNYLAEIEADFHRFGMSLRPSGVGPSDPSNLGVFAMREFEKGEVLFTERTIKIKEGDDGLINYFIGAAIQDLEISTWENQRPVHPLNRPDLGALTAAYNNFNAAFSWTWNVVDPLSFLASKDPKLLWNLDFDLWVYHTAEWRCSTNAFGLDVRKDGRVVEKWSVIARLGSFFQHSCEENVTWSGENGSADTFVMVAKRTILKGEEIFDSYGAEGDLETRCRKLRKWIDCCGCSLCVREEKEAAETTTEDVDSAVGMSDSTSASGGSESSNEVDADGDTRMTE